MATYSYADKLAINRSLHIVTRSYSNNEELVNLVVELVESDDEGRVFEESRRNLYRDAAYYGDLKENGLLLSLIDQDFFDENDAKSVELFIKMRTEGRDLSPTLQDSVNLVREKIKEKINSDEKDLTQDIEEVGKEGGGVGRVDGEELDGFSEVTEAGRVRYDDKGTPEKQNSVLSSNPNSESSDIFLNLLVGLFSIVVISLGIILKKMNK